MQIYIQPTDTVMYRTLSHHDNDTSKIGIIHINSRKTIRNKLKKCDREICKIIFDENLAGSEEVKLLAR